VNEVFRAASELQSVCEAQGWRFCFIGGLAQIRWGEPAFAGRSQDWVGIEPLIERQTGKLDWDYIRH
jgi:hypothetical protein